MPGLKPWWICGLFVVGVLLAAGRSDAELEAVTTIYLVRHAEKADSSGDVPLREEGFHRAAELRELLRGVPLAAIYSTDLRRTRQTVAPIAESSRLEPIVYSPADPSSVSDWADALIAAHRGKSVLVVGHSGPPDSAYSLASIVHELAGRPVAEIPETDYRNLFVVTVHDHGPDGLRRELERRRFGPLERLASPAVDAEDHELENGKQVSALVTHGRFLVVGADEKDAIQVLEAHGGGYRVTGGPIRLSREEDRLSEGEDRLSKGKELDIEGLARAGNTYYVLGSHSRKREKVEPGDVKTLLRSYAKNRKRLHDKKIEPERNRRRVYSFTFDPASGEVSKKRWIDLGDDVFGRDDVLEVFYELPSKENGIDLEGLAVDGEQLYLGFRGPVLRSGWVPVMRLELDKPRKNDLLWVNLGGRGIRELVKVSDGFLIIAGAVGDEPLSFQLHHWDGRDALLGERDDGDPEVGETTLLGTIPTPAGAKAEGLAVLAETDDHYEILVAYDGIDVGVDERGLAAFKAPRPSP